jgi:hypothetical protein
MASTFAVPAELIVTALFVKTTMLLVPPLILLAE